MKVYLLYRSHGYYEDYHSWVHGVYATLELAEAQKKKIIHEQNQGDEALTREQYDEIERFICEYEGDLVNSEVGDVMNDEEAIIAKHFPDINYADYQSFYNSLILNEDCHEPEIVGMHLVGGLK